MNEIAAPNSPGIPRWLLLLAIGSTAIGIGFRFYHLGEKIWWHDETWTGVHVGGHRLQDVVQACFTGRRISASELLRFQSVDPKSHFSDTMNALKLDDPKHPPLYYALARVWAVSVGDSVTMLRAMSAILSVLALPCAYWLARELFAQSNVSSSTVAAWALALFALSPFQVLYAQEAREYSLWTVTILLSTAALLRARRVGSLSAWAIYALALVAAWYSHTLTAMFVCIHAVYLLVARASVREWLRFAGAVVLSVLAFLPWAIVIVRGTVVLQANTGWLNDDLYSKAYLIGRFTCGIATNFVDLHPSIGSGEIADVLPVAVPVVILCAIAVGFVCRGAERSARVFVLCSTLIPMLLLLLPDLVVGGRRSSPYRYQIPMYVAIQMAVAYWIAAMFAQKRRLWFAVGIGVASIFLVGGIASCWMSSGERSWWSKGKSGPLLACVDVTRRAEHPLVISNSAGTNLGNVLSLAHLDPDLPVLLQAGREWPPRKEIDRYRNGDVFFLVDAIRGQKVNEVYGDAVVPIPETYFWQLRRAESQPASK